MKVAKLGEFGLIERIRRAAPASACLRLGIGDDCAVVSIPPGELLLTSTDLLIEGIHFRRPWTDWRRLGRKSATVNISDIAAMGGIPRCLYLGLGLPVDCEVADIEAFVAGFVEAAGEYGAVLAGGDTCRSPGPLLISVTAEGSAPAAEVVSRGGARPGDTVYVSGTLGDSALALHRLQSGTTPCAYLAGRHHDPSARVGLGRALAAAGVASAMIDVSDGLLADLGHVLTASAVGAEVYEAELPLSAPFREALAAEPEIAGLALDGGEDYELLFTVPAARTAEVEPLATATGIAVAAIGRITKQMGLHVIDRNGRTRQPRRGGFDHFAD